MSSARTDRRRWGLRQRILASTTGILSLAMTIAFTWSAINLRGILEERNDRFLRQKLAELIAALEEQSGGETVDPLISELRRESEAHRETGLIAVLHRGAEVDVFPESDVAHEVADYLRGEVGTGDLQTLRVGSTHLIRVIRSASLTKNGAIWRLDLGLDLQDTRATVGSFNRRLAVGGVACLALAVFGGIYLTRQAVQPVAACIAAARQLNPDDLSARLPLAGTHDELDQLASTINGLLERVHRQQNQLVRFTADASHELRSPIAALQAAIEIALQRDRTEDNYRELLGSLGEQCQRLTELVNVLLLLARADAGELAVDNRPFDLVDLVRQSIELFQPLADERSVGIAVDLPDQIRFAGDRLRLGQLLTNLLDNAIKFSDPGGCVHVALQPVGDSVELRVEDEGIGISSDHLPHVFDRFYRADESRSGRGTGLGLSICQWIVTAHRGTIAVNSVEGRGTSVVIVLPVSLPPTDQAS